MNPEEEFLKDKNIVESISFKDGKVHNVEIQNREKRTITDREGKEINGIAYLVKENGEFKRIFTSSIKLIQLLKDVKDGESVEIEMKKYKKGDEFRTTYEVKKGETSSLENAAEELGGEEIEEDDIPF